jgi:hypothetical protein
MFIYRQTNKKYFRGEMDQTASSEFGKEIFDIVVFALSAARITADEPPLYGALRLIDLSSKIIKLQELVEGERADKFLQRIRRVIEEKKYIVMASEEEFIKVLDQLVSECAKEMRNRRKQAK